MVRRASASSSSSSLRSSRVPGGAGESSGLSDAGTCTTSARRGGPRRLVWRLPPSRRRRRRLETRSETRATKPALNVPRRARLQSPPSARVRGRDEPLEVSGDIAAGRYRDARTPSGLSPRPRAGQGRTRRPSSSSGFRPRRPRLCPVAGSRSFPLFLILNLRIGSEDDASRLAATIGCHDTVAFSACSRAVSPPSRHCDRVLPNASEKKPRLAEDPSPSEISGAAVRFYSQRPDGALSLPKKPSMLRCSACARAGDARRRRGSRATLLGHHPASSRGCDPDGERAIHRGARTSGAGTALRTWSRLFRAHLFFRADGTVSLFYGERGAADAHVRSSRRRKPRRTRGTGVVRPGHSRRRRRRARPRSGTPPRWSRARPRAAASFLVPLVVVRISGRGMRAA